MLYSIMRIDVCGDVDCYAVCGTYEAAKRYADHLNDTCKDNYWVDTVEDDGGIGEALSKGGGLE